jgi:hypothetical protein
MKVSTVNLSPNLTSVDPAHGTIERGEMSADALTDVLAAFSEIDPALNLEHDPRVLVRTNDAWYAIRTERGRFHLYDARDTSQPGTELELADLVTAIQHAPAPAPITDLREPEFQPPPSRRKTKAALATALLLCGLGLNTWGVFQFFQRDQDQAPAAHTPIKDSEQTALYLRKLAGTHATGRAPGDRVIRITRDGRIGFDVIVRDAGGEIQISRGPVQACGFGRLANGAICLTTANSGDVGIGADGSLFYFGDTYRRIAALAE